MFILIPKWCLYLRIELCIGLQFRSVVLSTRVRPVNPPLKQACCRVSTSVNPLLVEMVAQRIAQDFQLVEQVIIKSRAVACSWATPNSLVRHHMLG